MSLVMYIIEGSMHCELYGKYFKANAGDVVLMDCTLPHYYQAEDGLEFIFLHYAGSNYSQITQELLRRYGPLIKSKNNYLIFNAINDVVIYNASEEVPTEAYMARQVACVLQELFDINKQKDDENKIIQQAISYISDNLNQPLTVDIIARQLHISPSSFAHKFKEHTSYSPLDYIINIRVMSAKRLLAGSNKSIGDIAYEVGGYTPNYFCNLFKKKTGYSPREYRKIFFDTNPE